MEELRDIGVGQARLLSNLCECQLALLLGLQQVPDVERLVLLGAVFEERKGVCGCGQ